jgi:oligopeptide/dipeptide ABC transporter ATP-binding protein
LRDEKAGGRQAAPPNAESFPLLRVERLTISYPAPNARIMAVRDLSVEVARGETAALIGESGCGKTTFALSIPGLLGSSALRESGKIFFRERDLSRYGASEWRKIRGPGIGMIFQDARSALNPVLGIGAHLVETLRAHQKITVSKAREMAKQILEEVGVPEPESFMKKFPLELSGGLCQRAGIALAICNSPELLIADEPTSALDPTIQARVLELLLDLKKRRGMALLLISHDLGLVTRYADRVLIMYSGAVVESGPREKVLGNAAHPYTRALLRSRPDASETRILPVIPGAPPRPGEVLPGCPFSPRCAEVQPFCTGSLPSLCRVSEDHQAACLRIGEIRPTG